MAEVLDERLYLDVVSPITSGSPGQFTITNQVYENGKRVPHKKNNSMYTHTEYFYEGENMVLSGVNEENKRIAIWTGQPDEDPSVPFEKSRLIHWITNEANRMSEEYHMKIEQSDSFRDAKFHYSKFMDLLEIGPG